jgi:hypothetical protein
MKKIYLLALLSSLLFTSMTCEDDYEEPNPYFLDEEGYPSSKWLSSVSQERFRAYVVGNGWRLTHSNGTVINNENDTHYNPSKDEPILPHNLYFSADSIYVFQYETTGNWLSVSSYTYNEANNRITNDLLPKMLLLSSTINSIETIEPIGTNPTGQVVTFITCMRKCNFMNYNRTGTRLNIKQNRQNDEKGFLTQTIVALHLVSSMQQKLFSDNGK